MEPQEMNYASSSFRSPPEYSFFPHAVERRKKPLDLPGPGKYRDAKSQDSPSWSIACGLHDLDPCTVDQLHCRHCEKQTLDSWQPPRDDPKRRRPAACATKGCAYVSAFNRGYCCCSCSKATPAPDFAVTAPAPARRIESETQSRARPKVWPGPGQYELKSTLEGVDVSGRGWIKPKQKDTKREALGPGHVEPRFTLTCRRAIDMFPPTRTGHRCP